MSKETEKTHNLEWKRMIDDSRGLPQLGVAPETLIQAAIDRMPTNSLPKQKQPKDPFKWGFYSALDAFLQKKL